MSNSSLVNYTKLSPNYSVRQNEIRKITIHHMAGNLSVEACGNVFASSSRQASSNYGIGSDGRVGMYVEEKNRSWCSSNANNDHQAVTIEVANDQIGGDWHVSDTALAKLIDLCVDICKRNGIERLNYTGDTTGNLTRHNMFVATTCPGPYLQSKFEYIAEEVNKRLQPQETDQKENSTSTTYKVQAGDTVAAICRKFYNGKSTQTEWDLIKNTNGLDSNYTIYTGQTLIIPNATSSNSNVGSNELKVGDTVKIVNTGSARADGSGATAGGIGWTRTVIKISAGSKNPYCVGANGVATGWYPASSLQKL